MEIIRRRLPFRIFFLIDVFVLLVVQIIQGTSLNFYFIRQYEEYFTTYFLFVLDFLCLCLFTVTFIVSYNYFTHSRDNAPSQKRKFTDSMEKHFPKSRFGVLPLSYASWLFYVAILIGKLAVIYGTDIVLTLIKDKHKLGSQILQVSVATSSIIFFLIVEGHNWHRKDTECYSYVSAVSKKIGIEIFDSVSMLDFIITTEQLSKPFENTVFVLACINFLLPGLSLYRLNISNFGKNVTPTCNPLRILHNVLRLVLIDIPFFVIRLRTWIVDQDLSIFIMKNLFFMLLTFRELYLDLFLYFRPIQDLKPNKKEEVPLSNEQTQTDDKGNV